MSRGDQLRRQWRILKELQTTRGGLSKEELAEEFECGVRTVDRDFEVFKDIGIHLDCDLADDGRRSWRLAKGLIREGSLVLSFEEALALHLAEQLFSPLAETHYAESIQSLIGRIRQAIPEKALAYFKELEEQDFVHVRSSNVTDYGPHEHKIRTIEECMRSGQSINITYKALGKDTASTLYDPYGLVYYDQGGDLYVIGRSHAKDGIRVLKASRLRDVQATTEAFERPDDFDLARQFENSWGIFRDTGEPAGIKVRFTRMAAELVMEKEWHPSQSYKVAMEEEPLFEMGGDSGDVIVTFHLSNVEEFKRWVKSFGDQAEVLEPAWLRQQVHEELLAAVGKYR